MSHALYIGRFQPPHHAHLASALAALEHSSQLTLALGSANLARSIKNPWTPAEREELWRLALAAAGADLGRVRFCALPDRFDAERWAADVRGLFAPGDPVTLVGYVKDDSSAYLHWFPGWERLVLPELEGGISATELRRAYFLEGPDSPLLPGHLPAATLPWLHDWANTPDYARLQVEWQAVDAAKTRFLPSSVNNCGSGAMGKTSWSIKGPGQSGQGYGSCRVWLCLLLWRAQARSTAAAGAP
ncbi:adenylyltransferase/cytidyltransferase family protein [Deinococcus radiophilus]|uniref:adenylyltransferase/cytidyltransferase family protein n=1 Tax=Deinococcus radiophilus TaxID=32062 RepID=UPI0036187855